MYHHMCNFLSQVYQSDRPTHFLSLIHVSPTFPHLYSQLTAPSFPQLLTKHQTTLKPNTRPENQTKTLCSFHITFYRHLKLKDCFLYPFARISRMIESSESEKNSRGPMFEFSSKEFSSSIMMDQGDSSSTEEAESPRSVVAAARKGVGERGRWRRWRKVNNDGNNNSDHKESNKGYLHSQVLRIKEEELQIGEEINLVGDYNDSYVENSHPLDDQFVIWSRSILPASPLSGKRNNNNRNG